MPRRRKTSGPTTCRVPTARELERQAEQQKGSPLTAAEKRALLAMPKQLVCGPGRDS